MAVKYVNSFRILQLLIMFSTFHTKPISANVNISEWINVAGLTSKFAHLQKINSTKNIAINSKSSKLSTTVYISYFFYKYGVNSAVNDRVMDAPEHFSKGKNQAFLREPLPYFLVITLNFFYTSQVYINKLNLAIKSKILSSKL